jgi:hypothetical protein
MWGASRRACSEFVMCHDGKELSLKLRKKTPRIRGAKLNLVLMDQMTNEHIVVVVRLEQLQWTHGEARMMGLLQITFVGYWRGTRMYSPIGCSKKSPPRSGKQLCSPRCWVLKLSGDEWSWWMNMMKVKAIQRTRWPLIHKELRSLFGLANYYHHFNQVFF